MPDILSLRARAATLVSRKALVAEALASIAAVTVRVEPAMVRLDSMDDEDDAPEGDRTRVESEVRPGMDVSILSVAGVYCLIGGTGSGYDGLWGLARNVEHHLAKSVELASESLSFPTGGEAPSLDGLSPFEIGAIVGRYTRAIGRMTFELREIATHLRYIHDTKAPLPSFQRTRCLGMFGKPDFDTRFSYVETDFKDYASIEERVPRADPSDPRGPWEFKRINLHPAVLSARALAPAVGDAAALRVEEALDSIAEATAPRPGEPPVLNHFGSHSTNRISVVYDPGEADVGDEEEPAPRGMAC